MKADYYTRAEQRLFKKLNSPKRIQDFLVRRIRHNPGHPKHEVHSPRLVLKRKKAHCVEGALLSAAILEFYGHRPLIMDLRSTHDDLDHVVALFRQFNCWGAISKTNHAVLRYREPVYKTIRELAMSYFHEYFLDSGKKTLREYSRPFDLRYFDRHPPSSKACPVPRYGEGDGGSLNWRTSDKDLEAIPDYLDEIKHYGILNKQQIKNLRRADKIEIRADKLIEHRNQ